MVVGDHWRDEIYRAIEKTDLFAMLLSKAAVAKTGFIQNEIRTAVREYKRRPHGTVFLLPIRLEECQIPTITLDENTTLSDLHWFDLATNDQSSLEELADAIRHQWQRIRELRAA